MDEILGGEHQKEVIRQWTQETNPMANVSLRQLTKKFTHSGVVVNSIDLEIADGELFTLLGPSGCGKTTTLRMIAGFEEPTSGTIWFDNRNVTNLAVNRRDIGIVFQNYALFPHLSVGKNVAFGLKARRTSRDEICRRVGQALAQVRLDGLEHYRVDQLSGGQQQRVALARALVVSPELLLLDEPLSNLDAKLRDWTRSELRRLHAETGKTMIYVTHDQAEALAMSTRVAVMESGTVHQIGAPEEVYDDPATRFVAEFLGRNNIIDGSISAISADGQVTFLVKDGSMFTVPAKSCGPAVALTLGTCVSLVIRAEDIELAAPDQTKNVLAGEVVDIEFVGAHLEIGLRTPVGQIRMDLPRHHRVVSGECIKVRFPPAGCRLFEAAKASN